MSFTLNCFSQCIDSYSMVIGLFPSIVVGDFNCSPQSHAFKTLTSSYLSNARSDLSAAIPTFIGFGSGSGTSTSIATEDVIDHILLSGFKTLPDSYHVHIAARTDASDRRLSDHRMVSVSLAMIV